MSATIPCSSQKRAFTLTEVMVAVLLGMLVLSSIIVIFSHQRRAFFEQGQINTMQSETRSAFDAIARDIRMAGYGLTDEEEEDANWITWLSSFTENPRIVDGGTSPDSIICIGAYDPPVAETTTALNKRDTTLTYSAATGSAASKFNFSEHNLICIGGVETARITGIRSGSIDFSTKHDREKGLKYAYPAGTKIELIHTVTYQVVTNGEETFLTRRDSNDNTIDAEDWEAAIASNIEDFQAARTNGVYRFTLTGRTDRQIPNASGDGYKRYTLTSSIIPKNQ